MNELLPGVLHWTHLHPKIKWEVSSYYLPEERVLIDPLIPADGIDAFPTKPEHILLTNRHHYRDCAELHEKLGCTIQCVKQGLHEFKNGEPVESFEFGQTLPGGIEALEVGVISPDETGLLIPRGDGLLAVADGIVRMGDSPLGFVPDNLLGDDAATIKSNLKSAYRGLLDRDFDHLLFAHGNPWIGGGKQALREFAGQA